MGLEPHGIISNTNEFSSVVPKSVTIPGKRKYASFEAYKDSRTVPKWAIRAKRQYQRARSVLHSSNSVTSSVADIASLTTDAKVASSQRATAAAADVVASMHSYAMPAYIRRPTEFTARLTTAKSSSGDKDSRRSNSASDTEGAVKQLVSVSCLNNVLLPTL